MKRDKDELEKSERLPHHHHSKEEELDLIHNMPGDNAIDAVRILPEKQRTISLFSAMEGDLFSVRCENPYSEKPETATTSSLKGHGLGLIILQNLAEKYHGHLEIQAEDGNFIATVWLFAGLKKN